MGDNEKEHLSHVLRLEEVLGELEEAILFGERVETANVDEIFSTIHQIVLEMEQQICQLQTQCNDQQLPWQIPKWSDVNKPNQKHILRRFSHDPVLHQSSKQDDTVMQLTQKIMRLEVRLKQYQFGSRETELEGHIRVLEQQLETQDAERLAAVDDCMRIKRDSLQLRLKDNQFHQASLDICQRQIKDEDCLNLIKFRMTSLLQAKDEIINLLQSETVTSSKFIPIMNMESPLSPSLLMCSESCSRLASTSSQQSASPTEDVFVLVVEEPSDDDQQSSKRA